MTTARSAVPAEVELFVPGRLCLFGEHTDWAGRYRVVHSDIVPGRAILAGTQQGIRALARRRRGWLLIEAPDGEGVTRSHALRMDPDVLLQEAEGGGFASYVAGVAHQILLHHAVDGIEIITTSMDLPIRKGLSSSAAACVLTARAFNRLYNLELTLRDEMELAYHGERTTPSQCGRLDQGCAFGNHAILMEFDGDDLGVDVISVASDLHLVVLDLGADKDTRAILRALHACYPAPCDERSRAVQEFLGTISTGFVTRARAAIAAGDAAELGRLMTAVQAAFDEHVAPACPEHLTAPALHRVLTHPALRPYVLGGKGVGSQGDGAAQFVVSDAADQARVLAIAREVLGLRGLPLTLQSTRDIAGADQPEAPTDMGTRGSPGGSGSRGSPGSRANRGSPGSRANRGSPGSR